MKYRELPKHNPPFTDAEIMQFYNYARIRIHSQTRPIACLRVEEEIENQAALIVTRALNQFDGSTMFRSYFNNCVDNAIRAVWKWSFTRKNQAKCISYHQQMAKNAGELNDILSELVCEDKRDDYELLDSLKRLLPADREVMKMLYLGYNKREICRKLGMSPGYTQWRLKVIRRRLQPIIDS